MGDSIPTFGKGEVRTAAANLAAGNSDAGANPANGDTSAGDALVTNDATQIEDKPNVGAAGSGSDPLNPDATQTDDAIVEGDQVDPLVEGQTEGEETVVDEETGLPENADLKQTREWGNGLLQEVKSLKPVVEEVLNMGGIEKIKQANGLYDALASSDYKPGDVLSALQQMSETRYASLIETAFTNHEDVFLKTLGLNPQQFKIAAKAVLEGSPVTAEDLASAEIPMGLSEEAWDAIPEAEQQKILHAEKTQKEQAKTAADAERQRKQQENEAARDKWSSSLDNVVSQTCDKFKIPTDEAGNKLRDKIRRNVWAAVSNDPKVAESFFASLTNFQNGEVQFATARQAQLENYFAQVAAEESEYYTENAKLKNEIAQLKLSRTNGRIEVKGSDSRGELSTKPGNEGITGNQDPNLIFDRKAAREQAAQIRR